MLVGLIRLIKLGRVEFKNLLNYKNILQLYMNYRIINLAGQSIEANPEMLNLLCLLFKSLLNLRCFI